MSLLFLHLRVRIVSGFRHGVVVNERLFDVGIEIWSVMLVLDTALLFVTETGESMSTELRGVRRGRPSKIVLRGVT